MQPAATSQHALLLDYSGGGVRFMTTHDVLADLGGAKSDDDDQDEVPSENPTGSVKVDPDEWKPANDDEAASAHEHALGGVKFDNRPEHVEMVFIIRVK